MIDQEMGQAAVIRLTLIRVQKLTTNLKHLFL